MKESFLDLFKTKYELPPTMLGIMPEDSSERINKISKFFAWLINLTDMNVVDLKFKTPFMLTGKIISDFGNFEFIAEVNPNTNKLILTAKPKRSNSISDIIRIAGNLSIDKDFYSKQEVNLLNFTTQYEPIFMSLFNSIKRANGFNGYHEAIFEMFAYHNGGFGGGLDKDIGDIRRPNNINDLFNGKAVVKGKCIYIKKEKYYNEVKQILKQLQLINKYTIVYRG